MVGWHHQLNGHEFEQALGVDNGQESLACCSPWDHKESHMTEQQRTDAFELWCWTIESPLDCQESKPVNPKGNQP